MRFVYQGYGASGKKIHGLLEANDLQQCQILLQKSGVFPTKISIKYSKIIWKRWSKAQFLFSFVQRMTSLLRMHYHVAPAMEALVKSKCNSVERECYQRICQDLQNGLSFSEALKVHPSYFSVDVIALIETSEKSGNLFQAFTLLSGYLKKQKQLKNRIITLWIYPIMLILFLSLVVLIFSWMLLPHMMGLFEENRMHLPLLTRCSIFFLKMMGWLIPCAGFIAILSLWKVSTKTSHVINQMNWVKKLWRVSSFYKKIFTYRFLQKMNLLIQGGITPVSALSLMKDEPGMEQVMYSVNSGQNWALSLRECPDIDWEITTRLEQAQGSEVGSLLHGLLENYEFEIQEYLDRFIKITEPVILLIMGLIIGFVVLAMFLPMLDLSQGIYLE